MSCCSAEPNHLMSAAWALNAKITKFLHTHFLWWLVGAYILGGVFPQAGLWMRNFNPADFGTAGSSGIVLKLLLAVLLFGAGFGIRIGRLRDHLRLIPVLSGGVVCAVAVPIAFLALLSCIPVADESRGLFDSVLIGLGVVAAMPVAGSSVGWALKSGGHLLLSVAFTLFSTLLSPLLVAFVLNGLASFLGNETLALEGSLAQGAIRFLMLWVTVPVLAGVSLRAVLRNPASERMLCLIRGINPVLLLLLNYSNASLSLPTMFHRAEQDVLLLVLLLSTALCFVNFGSAALLSRIGRLDRPTHISLLLGIGMRNNGAGLVLVATAIPHPEIIMLPIIVYNLLQHVAAGLIDRIYSHAEGDDQSH